MESIKREHSNSSCEVKLGDNEVKFGEERKFEIRSPDDEAKSITRSFKMKLKGRQESVRAVEFIPARNGSNAQVIGGREDKIAIVWDLETGNEKGT